MKRSSLKETELERARFAYSKVECIKDKTFAKEFKSYVKKLPSMIQTNGLAPAVAFIFSKKNSKEAYKYIYELFDEWLGKNFKKDNNSELMEWVIDQPVETYRAVTFELIALLSWLKRFAEGMIEGDKGDSDEKV